MQFQVVQRSGKPKTIQMKRTGVDPIQTERGCSRVNDGSCNYQQDFDLELAIADRVGYPTTVQLEYRLYAVLKKTAKEPDPAFKRTPGHSKNLHSSKTGNLNTLNPCLTPGFEMRHRPS